MIIATTHRCCDEDSCSMKTVYQDQSNKKSRSHGHSNKVSPSPKGLDKSANNYSIHQIVKGQDGNDWIVTERWVEVNEKKHIINPHNDYKPIPINIAVDCELRGDVFNRSPDGTLMGLARCWKRKTEEIDNNFESKNPRYSIHRSKKEEIDNILERRSSRYSIRSSERKRSSRSPVVRDIQGSNQYVPKTVKYLPSKSRNRSTRRTRNKSSTSRSNIFTRFTPGRKTSNRRGSNSNKLFSSKRSPQRGSNRNTPNRNRSTRNTQNKIRSTRNTPNRNRSTRNTPNRNQSTRNTPFKNQSDE